MTKYADEELLKQYVKEAQETGSYPSDFYRIIKNICHKSIASKKWFWRWSEDCFAQIVVDSLKYRDKINPDYNLFNYFTTCALNYYRKQYYNAKRTRASMGRYGYYLIAEGRMPEAETKDDGTP